MFEHLICLVVLFREVTEPSEGRFLLEEIRHWGGPVRSYFLALPAVAEVWMKRGRLASCSCLPDFPAACLSCRDAFYPFSTVSQYQPSLPGVAFGQGILFQKYNHHLKSRLYNSYIQQQES